MRQPKQCNPIRATSPRRGPVERASEVAAPNQRAPLSGAIQRAAADPRSLTRDDVMQLQRTVGNAAVASVLTEAASRANLAGLPDSLKAGVENLSSLAMDDVRVHYNSPKPAEVQALAYTQGPDIYVSPGQERHLPHEAWHVVQQKQGRVKPTLQMKGVAINDDSALEREADAMGQMIAGPRENPQAPTRDNGVDARRAPLQRRLDVYKPKVDGEKTYPKLHAMAVKLHDVTAKAYNHV